MSLCSLHNHTNLCDGADTPRAMALAASKAGFTDFGFSGHAKDPMFPNSLRDERAYVRAIRKLAAEYAGRMRIYCGIEEDSLVPLTHRDEFDYVIGSVHRLPLGDSSFCVDDTPEELQRGLSERFHGDGFALAQAYYEAVIDNVLTVKPEILGHFDLLTKFNEGCRFFDENSPEYLAAALEAAQTCAETGVIFEINTGGMARGWRTAPYPARPILQYLKDARIPVLVSTDCHSAAKIDYGMEQARALLRDVGFTETVTLEDGEFKEQPL